ncbi:MAG: hypothetical protein SGPRY_005795, partial [Prymnesium sp.]
MSDGEDENDESTDNKSKESDESDDESDDNNDGGESEVGEREVGSSAAVGGCEPAEEVDEGELPFAEGDLVLHEVLGEGTVSTLHGAEPWFENKIQLILPAKGKYRQKPCKRWVFVDALRQATGCNKGDNCHEALMEGNQDQQGCCRQQPSVVQLEQDSTLDDMTL